jgi:hypothetical protein
VGLRCMRRCLGGERGAEGGRDYVFAVHWKIPSDAFFLFAAYAGYVRFFNFFFVSFPFQFLYLI